MSFGLRFRLYLNFPGRIILILGVCLAILGILDIVLAVTGFVHKIWGHYYATGIWCGVVVFIDGLCGILASQTRTNFAVKTFFVFSVISVLVSFIMIILSCGGLDFRSNFYDRVFSYHGKHGRATKAVHGSLLALALVEFVVSIINALLCLKSSCQEDKASIKYDQSKLKQLSAHRPPSYKGSDQSQGFRGGNPNSVPVSEKPTVRRYQSPRRSHNGTGIYQEETPMDEPTETTEFLPINFASVEQELREREKGRQRLRSKEHENNKNTHHNKPPTRGRIYRRQNEQNNAETNPTKRNYDNQRKVQTHSTKPSITQQQPYYTQNENELNRWKHTDELVQSHQYYHMRHSDKTLPDKIPVQVLKATQYTEQNTAVLEPATNYKTIRETNPADPPPRASYRNSIERSTVPKPTTNNNTFLERNNSAQENRTPTRAPNRPGQDQRLRNRPLPMIEPQLHRKDHSEKFDRKGLYSERRISVERSNSFKENVDSEKKSNTKTLDRVIDNRHRQRLNDNQSNIKDTRPSRSNVPSGYRRTKDTEIDKMKDNLRSLVIKTEPLRRSIGARGSYSDAVNLMPTEPVEQTATENRTVKDMHNKPPTAFGEEELPAYAEICPNDSHIYSSLESALSRPETDRIVAPDQGAYSADHSLVSQSVADEEVQEILGTRNTNASTVVKTNFVSEIPYIVGNTAINSRTVQPNTTVIDLAQDPASTSTSHYKMPREDTVKGRLKHKLHLRPKEMSPDQSSSEASLALPSPLPPSPTFVRSHKTRASDLVPNPALHDIPDINIHQSFRASFPLRKSELDRVPRRWGVSPFVKTPQHVTPQVPASLTEKEGNALNELSSSFPLLGALGGVDFGISDQESYLQTPDSSVYTFNYDEVKPKVFTVSPYRTPRKSSPLSVISVPQLPSTEDEIENRPRVIETVNVGLASPPIARRKQNNEILPPRPGAVGQATSTHVIKPKGNLASSPEQPTSPHRPTYFYPPDRLPSRVINDTQNQTEVKQIVLPHRKESKEVSRQSSFSQPHSLITSGLSPVKGQTKVQPNWGSSRPEDTNVAFLAFNETLSQRTAWERQTFPPVQPQMTGDDNVTRPRTVGREAMRRVMRSEQSAQEEPLHQQSHTDYRFHFRIPQSNSTPEPSPPLTGGPPPYSSVARELPPQRSSDRAPRQPHSSGQSNRQNRSEAPRRQPVFSLVL